MEKFTHIKKIAETIAASRIVDRDRLAELLGGAFDVVPDAMQFHFVLNGRMNASSPFSACELRLPKSSVATSAVISCDLADGGPDVDNVVKAYGERLSLSVPRARASPTQPAYMSVSDGVSKISYGYDRASRQLRRVVIDIKTKEPN